MKSGMPRSRRSTLIMQMLVALTAIALVRALMASGDEPSRDSRVGTLQFAPEMPEADRAWVRAAVAAARPEAQRLIDEVDGVVVVGAEAMMPEAIGRAHLGAGRARIDLDTAVLNADRALDRNVVVLHEFGHVVDHLLVSDALVRELDAAIPRGTCQSMVEHIGACSAIEERFADTFAKWALGGAVSMAGSGYGIPTPASLEDWGAPLGRLAAQLTVDARD
jgi:predicted TIM-barrel fold metal-dependent hydrolase